MKCWEEETRGRESEGSERGNRTRCGVKIPQNQTGNKYTRGREKILARNSLMKSAHDLRRQGDESLEGEGGGDGARWEVKTAWSEIRNEHIKERRKMITETFMKPIGDSRRRRRRRRE